MPRQDWETRSRNWDNPDWDGEIRMQALQAALEARKVNPMAFPITDEDWLEAVKTAWQALGEQRPRGAQESESAVFRPRTRLVSAIRTAWLKLLFDRMPYRSQYPDFPGDRPPINLRTFAGWCPRLEALELIFYTDAHPKINGRLLFPVSVFRAGTPTQNFSQIADISDPFGRTLWLYQPSWEFFWARFVETLVKVHWQMAARSGTIYVSLLSVRDEVCRQLRVSSMIFDQFLEKSLDLLPTSDFPWSIAVETDVREDQSSAPAQYRRPVYIKGVPHSLIGLAHLRS